VSFFVVDSSASVFVVDSALVFVAAFALVFGVYLALDSVCSIILFYRKI